MCLGYLREVLTNKDLAELLAVESTRETDRKQKALRRASRRAFLWQQEAGDLLEEGGKLTDLEGVGPYTASVLLRWFESPTDPLDTPSIRSDFLTFTEARRILETDSSWRKHLKGDLQMHSEWSDGYASLEEIARAAVEIGHDYIAITEHSKGLPIARGMDEERFSEQGRAIDGINRSGEFGRLVVLRSIEMNLSVDGKGDMDPTLLSSLDIVLGSFHSKLRVKEDQTDRYIAAIENPDVHILGHPKGRIYNFREGLSADWGRVFSRAAELDKAVEIDSFPDRQDLSVSLLQIAREAGVRISIGTDAHHPSQLWFIDFGMAAALAAGIPADRIINFMPVAGLLEWAKTVRERAAARL